jgi:hypothetical protein
MKTKGQDSQKIITLYRVHNFGTSRGPRLVSAQFIREHDSEMFHVWRNLDWDERHEKMPRSIWSKMAFSNYDLAKTPERAWELFEKRMSDALKRAEHDVASVTRMLNLARVRKIRQAPREEPVPVVKRNFTILVEHMKESFRRQDENRPKRTKRFFGGSPSQHLNGTDPGYVDIPITMNEKDPHGMYTAIDYYLKDQQVHFVDWTTTEKGYFELSVTFDELLACARKAQNE